jgi:hypothetical protein
VLFQHDFMNKTNQELREKGKDFLLESDSSVPAFLTQNFNHRLHG